MKLLELLEKSSITLIEGEKRSGKFLFSCWIAKELQIKNLLIVSFYEKIFYQKKLKQLEGFLQKDFLEFILQAHTLNIKPNADELKRKDGYEFMLEDIKRALERFDSKMLILQRPDLFFTIQDQEDIEYFLTQLLELCERKGVKLVILSNIENGQKHFFVNWIENYIDLNLVIKKETPRVIEIDLSLFPTRETQFVFSLFDGEIEIKALEQNLGQSKQKILVISENQYLIDIHRYLLKNEESFELQSVTNISDAINLVLSKPDTIIYYDKSEKINLDIVSKHKDINAICFSDKDFIRNEDLMLAYEHGCKELFSNKFRIEAYLAIFQKIHNNFFYSKKLQKLPNTANIRQRDKFIAILSDLIEQGIFFTLIKSQTPIDDEKLEYLRSQDIFYQESGLVYIIVMNLRKVNMEPVLEKLQLEKSQIEAYEAVELEANSLKGVL